MRRWWPDRHFRTDYTIMKRLGLSSLRKAIRAASFGSHEGPTIPSRLHRLVDAATTAAKYSAVALAGAGVTVLSVSAALSTPQGLQALLSFINTKVPGVLTASHAEFALDGWSRVVIKLHGLDLKERPSAGGQRLVAAQVIECSGTLLEILRGEPTGYHIRGGTVNGGYNPAVREFRLIRFLEEAGVMEAPPPPASVDKTHPDNTPATTSSQDTAITDPGADRRNDTAMAVAQAGGRDLVNKSVSVEHRGGGDESEPGAFMRALSDTSDSVGLTGEFREPGLRVVVEDSRLLVSSDIRDILGGDLRVVGAFAEPHLRWFQRETATTQQFSQQESTLDSSQDSSGDRQDLSPPPAATTPATSAVMSQPPQQGLWWSAEPGDEVSRQRLSKAREQWGGDQCIPGEWLISAPHLDMRMRVWEVTPDPLLKWSETPEETEPFTLLHTPATFLLKFSNALSRFGLATVNPLLGRVTSLTEGTQGYICATFAPDGMMLPYTSASIWVEPMCLNLAGQHLVASVAHGLRRAGLYSASWAKKTGHAQPSGSPTQRPSQGATSSEPQTAHSTIARAQHTVSEDSSADDAASLLEAWLSGQHIRFERTGVIRQCRVDMLIGAPGLQQDILQGGDAAERARHNALHLVLWGETDPDNDTVDMVVGIPESVLERMGAKGLPDDYCLPLRLSGDTDNPRLELSGISRRVAQLVMLQAAQKSKELEQQAQAEAAAEQTQDLASKSSGTDRQGQAAQQGQGQQDAGLEKLHEPHHGRRKAMLKRVVKTAKVVWAAAVHLLTPGEQSLAQIREQIERDTKSVPPQECSVPWLRVAQA